MIIKQTRNTLSDTYLDAMRIRQQVFVKEQGVPRSLEIDAKEPYCLHFVLYTDDNKAVATCRILPDSDHRKANLQRMAVLQSYRKQSLGKQLLQYLIEYLQSQGFQAISLHAQLPAQAFYQNCGFVQEGQTFQEAGIDHTNMTRTL